MWRLWIGECCQEPPGAVLLLLAVGQLLCSSCVLSAGHTLSEWKALVHAVTPFPARCSLCIESVLWFTSLSDSSLSDFKGVVALLQPLATRGEWFQPGEGALWLFWEGCAASSSTGCLLA